MKSDWMLRSSSSTQTSGCKTSSDHQSITESSHLSPRLDLRPAFLRPRLLLSSLLEINLGVNDIAIIKVKNSSSPMECLERAVVPACLPSPEEEFSSGLMSGWGKLGDSQTWSRLLRAAPVNIVSRPACNRNVRILIIFY